MNRLLSRIKKVEKSRHRDILPALAMGQMCFHCGAIVTIDDENPCGHHSLLPDATCRLVMQHIIGSDGLPTPPIPGCTKTIRVRHEIGVNVV